MKTGTFLAIVIFLLVALAHLLRLLMSIEVTIADWQVPAWPSGLAVVVSTVVAILLFQESRYA